MITLNSCPVCKSYLLKEYRVMLGGGLTIQIIPDVHVDAGIITRYCQCQDCHLIFQNPRFSDAELEVFYSQGYYRRMLEMGNDEKDEDELYRAKIDAKIIRQNIGKVAAHLDVGCGRGYFLEAVGASVKVGVESDAGYVKAKGIRVYLDISRVPQKLFDLVSTIHVLEHVPYPLDYLKNMAKFVSKSGYLVIEVSTWESPGGVTALSSFVLF